MIQMKRIPYGDHGDGFSMPELDYEILKLYIFDHLDQIGGPNMDLVRWVLGQLHQGQEWNSVDRWKAIAIITLARKELGR